MLDSDEVAKAVPVRKDEWKRAFPHLDVLIDRIGEQGRYDRFDLIKLKRWSAGRVAIVGDAAHALPPNIGQGGGCAMMNALSLAVYLERENDVAAALQTWERKERPMTEHTQRISYFLGLPTTWPPALRAFALGMVGRSKWLTRATHAHRAAPADGDVDASKRNRDAIQRRVAIDEVDALPGDHDAAVGLHQAMQRGAAEQALLLAAIFDHHEFGAHGAGVACRSLRS